MAVVAAVSEGRTVINNKAIHFFTRSINRRGDTCLDTFRHTRPIVLNKVDELTKLYNNWYVRCHGYVKTKQIILTERGCFVVFYTTSKTHQTVMVDASLFTVSIIVCFGASPSVCKPRFHLWDSQPWHSSQLLFLHHSRVWITLMVQIPCFQKRGSLFRERAGFTNATRANRPRRWVPFSDTESCKWGQLFLLTSFLADVVCLVPKFQEVLIIGKCIFLYINK